MNNVTRLLSVFIILLMLVGNVTSGEELKRQCGITSKTLWRVHDMNRPQPPRITPAFPGKAPSDAIVLFDGKDLSQWTDGEGNPAPWKVVDGIIEVVPQKKNIYTKQSFGDCQLHVEWMTPVKIKNPADAGNSGVKMMGLYEVQIFDSWTTTPYADGNAGSLYGKRLRK